MHVRSCYRMADTIRDTDRRLGLRRYIARFSTGVNPVGRKIKPVCRFTRARVSRSTPMYYAVYRDDRDASESAIDECPTIADAYNAITEYFRNWPESLEHLVYWAVVKDDGTEIERGNRILK